MQKTRVRHLIFDPFMHKKIQKNQKFWDFSDFWERRRAHFQRLNSNSRVASDHQIVIIIMKTIFMCKNDQKLKLEK